MKKRILLLNDRFPARDSLINLGDRAMLSGLYRTVEESLGYEIVSGGCKNFPRYDIRRYRKERANKGAEAVFAEWFDETLSAARRNSAGQKDVSDFLDGNILFRNRLFGRIDAAFKARYSRGLVDTVKPFLLKSHCAARFLERIDAADCVLFNGAAIVADRFSFYLPAVLFECYLAKRLGKKVFTINQTIDIEDPLNAEMVSLVYGRLDLHLTREAFSCDALRKLGIGREKLVSSCDAAFAAEYGTPGPAPRFPEMERPGTGAVGLVIRGDREVDFDTWARIIMHLREERGKQVFLAFSCITQDGHVYDGLARRCGIERLSRFHDYKELARLFERCAYVISDRYHALIFAVHGATPVIPINPAFNTIKTEGLFRLIDYPVGLLPPVGRETYDRMVEAIRYVEENHGTLKEILATASVEIRNKFAEDIKAISREMGDAA